MGKPVSDLVKFYQETPEESSELVSRAIRKLTLDDEIRDIHTTQESVYEVRDENGTHVVDVTMDGQPKGTFYLGSGKYPQRAQSVLTYVMFNVAYRERPEALLHYKFMPKPAILVELFGTLYSERLREQMGSGHKEKFLRNPVMLGVVTTVQGKAFNREFVFNTVESMQDRAQALRCLAFNHPEHFLEVMVQYNDEHIDNFIDQQWLENTGASETQLQMRDHKIAGLLEGVLDDPVHDNGQGDSDRSDGVVDRDSD